MESKTCTHCREVKDLDQFFKNRATKDGYQGHCKLCRAIRLANPPPRGKDRVGQRFGRLIVIERTEIRDAAGGTIVWLCRCDCGKTKLAPTKYLVGGNTSSCGCLHRDARIEIAKGFRLNLLGKRFGRLVVIRIAEELPRTNSPKWECLCDCGRTCFVQANYLSAGRNESCGCSRGINRNGQSSSKELKRFYAQNRMCAKRHRTPKWADYERTREIYANCPSGYEVDHIIPLQGKLVSGFHIAENLQYLLATDNARKFNRFTPQFIPASESHKLPNVYW